MMRIMQFLMACVVVIIAAAGQAQAGVYMRSTVGIPWGDSSNEQAMNAAFGAGNWQDLRYETANAFSVFSSANSFAFLEGSDSNANELESFLTTNMGTIQAWVAAGGSLFLNAAPNEGDGMNFGFGGVALNYVDFAANPVSAVDASHPIFNGPLLTNTSLNGSYFGHATLSGPGLINLITDSTSGVYLAEMDFGLGHVIFGGMTTTGWHSPQPEGFNLRVNILEYAAAQANQTPVPEPTSLAIFSLCTVGMGITAARRRRQQEQAA